jgi:hypothetical protein
MMQMTLITALLATNFTLYLGPNNATPQIEAITDRGLILEMIVKCSSGNAIITYSKVEKVYCGPRRACSGNQATVIQRACG